MKHLSLCTLAAIVLLFAACGHPQQPAQELSPEQQQAADSHRQDSIKDKHDKDSLQVAQQAFINDSIAGTHIKGYRVKIVKPYTGACHIEVEYTSLMQLLSKSRKQAKDNMWTPEKLQSDIDLYMDRYRGGTIQLLVTGSNIDLTDIGNFTIIVKDTADKELFRNAFEKEIPKAEDDHFRSFGLANIENSIPSHFFIYVTDVVSTAPAKYEVTPIMN
jgi:hypothetical protein